MSADTIISGQGVVKRWGTTTALDGASFTVQRGVTGLLGANGAGKTTLLGMILGLHRPDQGALQVFGLDPMTAGAKVRERLGYSPEHHVLPGEVQAFDLVRHIAELHGLPRRDATNRASDALYAVGLGEERFRPIGTMSTGQKQRVKLAQAIAHDPQLVLLDEPTDGLDPMQRDQMLELIRRCALEFGIDVFLSSHLLEEVERVCDAVVILGGGQVVANAPLGELQATHDAYLLDVDGDVVAVMRCLEQRMLTVSRDGTQLIIDVIDDAQLDTIRDVIADVGAGIRRFERRRRSLEDVFLELLDERHAATGVR
ncbi:MAG: ABC transporter ATP-binding protein [Actinobacteria bacterium]|jgi:ABC-2 type transport system ATP-binding protein|nr:MAG: ABC transporter ATP-binding protein [Actinomycetota bacterium]